MKNIKKAIIGMAVILLPLLSGCIGTEEIPRVIETYVVLETNAPFGNYWTESNGLFIVCFGAYHSSPSEYYSIKYIDEEKGVITLKWKAEDLGRKERDNRVHLLNSTDEMYLDLIVCDTGWFGDLTRYELYIPDPRLYD